MKRAWLVLPLALLAASRPAPAVAQPPATSFDQLSRWVRIGDTIYVTDTAGHEVRGSIAEVSASALRVAVGDVVREYQEAGVRSVARRAPDSLSNGAWIGLAVGAGFAGLVVGLASADDCCGPSAGFAVLGIGLYGAMGAGIGVGIDALVPGRMVTIFAKDATRARVRIAPTISPHRQGLGVSISF